MMFTVHMLIDRILLRMLDLVKEVNYRVFFLPLAYFVELLGKVSPVAICSFFLLRANTHVCHQWFNCLITRVYINCKKTDLTPCKP